MASNVQGSPVKALIVEDMKVDTLVLSMMLRSFHCEVTATENGKDAVDLFIVGKKFDIVLLEKDLPIMSGPEAVEKIRAIGEASLKIVGLSIWERCCGSVLLDNAEEAFMRAGADVFVPKPMKLDVLGAMIQEVFNKKNNAVV